MKIQQIEIYQQNSFYPIKSQSTDTIMIMFVKQNPMIDSIKCLRKI
jgi:hypothetical protein